MVEMVKLFIKKKYDKPGNVFTGVIHRIDRPVSGLVLFAKTNKALSRMNELFKKKKKITKTYWCLTEDIPQEKEGWRRSMIEKMEKNKSFV